MDNEKLLMRFEVDSVVHPELHRLLSSIKSPKLRADRLRVLAEKGILLDTSSTNIQAKIKDHSIELESNASQTKSNSSTRPALKLSRNFASKKESD
jgi:hypothetical protein